MLPIDYFINGLFALIPYKIQDTEPLTYLENVSGRSSGHYNEVKDGFYQVRKPDLTGDPAVRFLLEQRVVIVLVAIDIDGDDDDGCIQIQKGLKTQGDYH